jgi:hypothetical protein
MDIKVLLDAVSLVGFPIVMCLIFIYYVKYLNDTNRDQINQIQQQHRQETGEMTKAIENNTIALTKLIDKLGGE